MMLSAPTRQPHLSLVRGRNEIAKPDTASPRILVAAEDPISRRMLSTMVARWGFVVETVDNGLAALKKLRAIDAPRLALLDWTMPGLDGAGVCEQLRDEQRPCYLVLITAHGSAEEIVEGLRAGANDYVTTPFDPAVLQARLGVGVRVLERQHEIRGEMTRPQLDGHRETPKLKVVGRRG